MSQHTRAPWTLRPTHSDDRVTIEAQGDDGLSRCIGEIHGAAAPEGYANARLIAAAPDLLRELAHLVRLLEPLEGEGVLDVPGLATLNGARAAIARAQGEEPR